MTPRELEIARAFANVSFPQATSQKRFALAMIAHAKAMPDKPLTPKQSRYLTILAWRFRRQMPAHLAYPEDEPLREYFIPPAAVPAFVTPRGTIELPALGPVALGQPVSIVKSTAIGIVGVAPIQPDLFDGD